jgi:hypothetical protein
LVDLIVESFYKVLPELGIDLSLKREIIVLVHGQITLLNPENPLQAAIILRNGNLLQVIKPNVSDFIKVSPSSGD